jgi:hypothetical protein
MDDDGDVAVLGVRRRAGQEGQDEEHRERRRTKSGQGHHQNVKQT